MTFELTRLQNRTACATACDVNSISILIQNSLRLQKGHDLACTISCCVPDSFLCAQIPHFEVFQCANFMPCICFPAVLSLKGCK